ncbi:hypothetical protein FSPOR_4111 [Fusarium sporotrichioides]|uniref:CBM-cenC domain-containing protein n=1 Tax=Fusarium sporotrichioides TaxID=5514 RepID=A0A395SCR9_FUSSP|nr:hypothetical protein FSPOR_4111 [Fusarium sporotrichioides]
MNPPQIPSPNSPIFAYATTNILGVNAGLCRPSTRTSLTSSGAETQTSSSLVASSTVDNSALPTDATSNNSASSTEETTANDPTTSGSATLSTTETLSYLTSSGTLTTSDTAIPTLSTIVTSKTQVPEDSTTSGSPSTSSDDTTSIDSTTSGDSGSSTESVDPTTSGNPTTTTGTATSAETTTSVESTTSLEPTTTAGTTTAVDTTTTADTTTTSEEPTTTTSVCVEPTEMLRQPGFEPSADGNVWGFYWGGGYITNDAGNARTGDGLAVLPVPDGRERRMEQRVHIVPDTEYTVSFYYAVSNPPSFETQCFLFATFDYYTTLAQVPLPSDTDYHLYSAGFISADNLDPAIEIGVSCPQANNGYTATVYIDDASVMNAKACDTTPVDPNNPPKSTLLVPAQPEAPLCPVNLAQVPGFEPEDGEQAWAFYNRGEFVQDASNARTGEWEALLPSGTMQDAIYLEQQFSAQDLEAGEIYDYHFFWKPNTLPDNGRCYIYGGYNDAIGFTAAEVKFGATSSTGYTIFSARFAMPAGDLLLQIVFYCNYNNGNQQLGSVYVDDTALIKVGGCEAYPVTGALIENPSFEIRATEDSSYAWFGTNGMTIKAGSTSDGPSPNSGNNYLYVQLKSTRQSATLTKPLAKSLNAGQSYTLQFNWAAGSSYTPGDCSFTIAFGSVTQVLGLDDSIDAYQYQQIESTFTAAEEVKSMSLTVSCSTSVVDFALDDFLLQ